MDKTKLQSLKLNELGVIAKSMDIDIKLCKKDIIIEKILLNFSNYLNYQKNIERKYNKKEILGKPGKEGIVYRVVYRNKDYAMKTFKSVKSTVCLEKEAELLTIASKSGISPKVKEINTVFKFIVMDKIDTNLFDHLKSTKGEISNHLQTEIIRICMTLDKIKIFHGDPNPLNFMIDEKDKLFIIDYGFGKKIDDKLVKTHGTKNINMKFMILGLILKLRGIFKQEIYGKISYHIFNKYLTQDEKIKFDI